MNDNLEIVDWHFKWFDEAMEFCLEQQEDYNLVSYPKFNSSLKLWLVRVLAQPPDPADANCPGDNDDLRN